MIDQARNPKNTYRVDSNWGQNDWGNLNWQVKVYEFGGGNVSYIVREDQIPQWLLDRMKTLDIAYKAEGVELPGYGSRFGSTYWIMADQVNGVESQSKQTMLASWIDTEDITRISALTKDGPSDDPITNRCLDIYFLVYLGQRMELEGYEH